jgi:hypothetical protein
MFPIVFCVLSKYFSIIMHKVRYTDEILFKTKLKTAQDGRIY